jgi:hypothetical protein
LLECIAGMYTGTLINDLFALVEHVERFSVAQRLRDSGAQIPARDWTIDAGDRGKSEAEKFPQALGLCAADGNLGLLLVVHPKLVGTLEPGDDLADAVDIHQVGAVSAPE